MKNDLITKIVASVIGILLTGMLSMCAWYLNGLSQDIRFIRDDIQELKIDSGWMKKSIEINAGGDPASVSAPEE